MRKCSKYEITMEQFINFCHTYTERIKIHVVFRGEKDFALKSPRMHDFYLTENLSESEEEIARMLKYYANVPLWNLCIESQWAPVSDRKGCFICSCLVAHCNYSDIAEGYAQEKKDRKRNKKRWGK